MGNQGHSYDEARTGYDLIVSGAIGEVREVHVWTNRPLGYWPQGIPRPALSVDDGRSRRRAGTAVRSTAPWRSRQLSEAVRRLDWNLFLGGAPEVDYSPDLPPIQLAWLGGLGPGALGDMGAPSSITRSGR